MMLEAARKQIPETGAEEQLHARHKVTLNGRSSGKGTHRVTLPRPTNFFESYPKTWSWDTWAKRAEQEWLMMARGFEAVIWGTVGGLLGLALAAIPGAFVENYHYVVWQPVGAATGALLGAVLVWRRWRQIFESHHMLTR